MSTFTELLWGLSGVVDLINSDLGSHNRRVAYIAFRLTDTLKIPREKAVRIVLAAAIHDLGILRNNNYTELKSFNYDGGIDQHSRLGYRLLSSCNLTSDLAPMILYHHVWHKDRLKYNQLPFASQIIHLSDRLDVLIDHTKDLLYERNAYIQGITKESGEQFHPTVVEAFQSVSKEESFWFDLQFHHFQELDNWLHKDQSFDLSLIQLHELGKLFTRIIDFRSSFTAEHSTLVSLIAAEIGRLFHLSEEEILMLDIAGHFHDIGKLRIPLEILEKPGKLDEKELSIMKQHPYWTFQVLRNVNDPVVQKIREWAHLHHERVDGTGYPWKLPASRLPLGARILTLADVFTALSESRPYRSALKDEQIIHELKQMSGTVLDPPLVEVALENYSKMVEIRKEAFNLAQEDKRHCVPCEEEK